MISVANNGSLVDSDHFNIIDILYNEKRYRGHRQNSTILNRKLPLM